MKVKFIVKPPSKKVYRREFLKFKKDFEADEEFTEKEGLKNAKNLAERAVKEGYERIVLVGGDGILNEGINGIMKATGGKIPPDFSIGIIPTGSGNNFSKALNIPKNMEQAFNILKGQKTIAVDVGKANDRFFINVVSFGFDALINRTADEIREKYSFLPKAGAYLFGALKEVLLKIPVFEIKIRGDGVDFEGKATLVAISNGPSYGAIFKIAPEATFDDGKLDICLIEPVGKLRALSNIYRVTQGTHTCLPETKMFKSSFLEISSPNPLPCQVDGEVLDSEKEYRIHIFPQLLRILVS